MSKFYFESLKDQIPEGSIFISKTVLNAKLGKSKQNASELNHECFLFVKQTPSRCFNMITDKSILVSRNYNHDQFGSSYPALTFPEENLLRFNLYYLREYIKVKNIKPDYYSEDKDYYIFNAPSLLSELKGCVELVRDMNYDKVVPDNSDLTELELTPSLISAIKKPNCHYLVSDGRNWYSLPKNREKGVLIESVKVNNNKGAHLDLLWVEATGLKTLSNKKPAKMWVDLTPKNDDECPDVDIDSGADSYKCYNFKHVLTEQDNIQVLNAVRYVNKGEINANISGRFHYYNCMDNKCEITEFGNWQNNKDLKEIISNILSFNHIYNINTQDVHIAYKTGNSKNLYNLCVDAGVECYVIEISSIYERRIMDAIKELKG